MLYGNLVWCSFSSMLEFFTPWGSDLPSCFGYPSLENSTLCLPGIACYLCGSCRVWGCYSSLMFLSMPSSSQLTFAFTQLGPPHACYQEELVGLLGVSLPKCNCSNSTVSSLPGWTELLGWVWPHYCTYPRSIKSVPGRYMDTTLSVREQKLQFGLQLSSWVQTKA